MKIEINKQWKEEIAKDIEKKEKEVEQLETEIAKIEEEKKKLEAEMARPEVYSNGEKCRAIQLKINEFSARLDSLNEQWEKAAEALG